MATSSITKNFVISGNQQVEMYADAVEASANNRPVRIPVKADFLTDPADIIKLMEKICMQTISTRLSACGVIFLVIVNSERIF